MGFHSLLLFVSKASSGWRLVLDVSTRNTFLKVPSFTMDMAEIIRVCLIHTDQVSSLDLSNAYLHVPIHRLGIFYVSQSSDPCSSFKLFPLACPLLLGPSPESSRKSSSSSNVRASSCSCNWTTNWTTISQHVSSMDFGTTPPVLGLIIKSDLVLSKDFTFLGYNFVSRALVVPTVDMIWHISPLAARLLLVVGAEAKEWQAFHGEVGSSRTYIHVGDPIHSQSSMKYCSRLPFDMDSFFRSRRSGPCMWEEVWLYLQISTLLVEIHLSSCCASSSKMRVQ